MKLFTRKFQKELLIQTIQTTQLKFIEHCLHRDEVEFANQHTLYLYIPKLSHGKWRKGRPKLMYLESITTEYHQHSRA